MKKMNSHGHQDLTQLNMIPSFGDSGRTLSETERREMIRRKGLCESCGLVKVTELSANLFRRKNKNITNDDVWEGICIRCNQDRVPGNIAAEWERRNVTRNMIGQKSARLLNTSRTNLSSAPQRRTAPRRIQSERIRGSLMSPSSSSATFSRKHVGRTSSSNSTSSFRGLAMSPDDTSRRKDSNELFVSPSTLRLPKALEASSSRRLASNSGNSYSMSSSKSAKDRPMSIIASFRKQSLAVVLEALQSLRYQIVYEGVSGMECIQQIAEILTPGASVSSVQETAGAVLWILAAANELNASGLPPPDDSTIDYVTPAFCSCIDIPDETVACILRSIRPDTLEWGARCLRIHIRLVDEIIDDDAFAFVAAVMEEKVEGSTALFWAGQFTLALYDHLEVPKAFENPKFLSFLLKVLEIRVKVEPCASHDLLVTIMEVLTHIVESADSDMLRLDFMQCCSIVTRAIFELSENDERVTWASGRLLAVVLAVAEPSELIQTIVMSEVLEALICAMKRLSANSAFVAVVGFAFWKLTSLPDAIQMSEAREIVSIIAAVAGQNRGQSDHRDLSLSLCAIVSNICILPEACFADLPIFMLGDAITHHPSDPIVCEHAFRSLSRILCLFPESLGDVFRNLERPNIVVAFSVTPPTSDADIVAMVNAVEQMPMPAPLLTLLSQLIRRMGARLQYLRDEVRLKELFHNTSLLAIGGRLKGDPQIALIIRRLEKIVNDQQLIPKLRADCCLVLRDLVVYSEAIFSLSNILSALQYLSGLQEPDVDVKITSLLFAVASTTDRSAQPSSSMFTILLRILHKHNHVDAPYESDVFRLGSGAISALCSLSTFQLDNSDFGSIAESAYKVLESDKSDSDTIANFLFALLSFCDDALDALFESGTIVMVNDVMNEIPSCESIQEIGCCILSYVTAVESMDMFLIIMQTDGLRALACAIEDHSGNDTIRSAASEALRRLSSLPAMVPELATMGVVNKIIPLMEEHRNDVPFCINAIQLLGYMADSEEPFQKKPDFAVVSTLFGLLQSESDSAELFYHCLSYLRILNLEHLPTQSRKAWIALLLETLETFIGMQQISIATLELLKHLYDGDDGHDEPLPAIVNAGAVTDAILALIENPAAVKAGLTLFQTIDGPRDSKMFTVVILVLYIFYENEELAALSLDLLQVITERNEWTGYEVDAIVGTLINFVDSFAIQRRGTNILFLVSQKYQCLLKERAEQLVPVLTMVQEAFDGQDCGAMAQALLQEIEVVN